MRVGRPVGSGLSRIVQRLPKRWHDITHELAKFGTIGVINLFVNFAVFNLLFLTMMRGGELKAKAVAAIVATTCSYFMNRHWTYRHRPKSTLRREYSLFFFFNLVGMVIEVGIVGITKYGLHETHIIALNISTAIGIALGTLFRFWAYRTHVFKPTIADTTIVDTTIVDTTIAGTSSIAAITIEESAIEESAIEEPATPNERATIDQLATVNEPAAIDQPATAGEPAAIDEPTYVESGELQPDELDEIELDGIVALSERPMGANS